MSILLVVVTIVSVLAMLINFYFWSSTKKDIETFDVDDEDREPLRKKNRNIFFISTCGIVFLFLLAFVGPRSASFYVTDVVFAVIGEAFATIVFLCFGNRLIAEDTHNSNS